MHNDLTKLKELAERATPGPWVRTVDGVMPETGQSLICCAWGLHNMLDNLEFISAANPQAILGLIAEVERLRAALSTPETITAEPAADYETLRKQFMSLRSLANSNAKMVHHWRQQSSIEMRETLLVNAENVNAERTINEQLTYSLLDAEDKADRLKAENEALRKDAERYKALRQKERGGLVVRDRTSHLFGESLDAAIDAALEGGGK